MLHKTAYPVRPTFLNNKEKNELAKKAFAR